MEHPGNRKRVKDIQFNKNLVKILKSISEHKRSVDCDPAPGANQSKECNMCYVTE